MVKAYPMHTIFKPLHSSFSDIARANKPSIWDSGFLLIAFTTSSHILLEIRDAVFASRY